MASFLDAVAPVITLAALVGIFLSLRQQSGSLRFRLWTAGWIVVLLHVAVNLMKASSYQTQRILDSVSVASVGVAGLVFLLSMSALMERRRWRWALIALVGIPLVGFATALGFEISSRPVLLSLMVAMSLSGSVIFVAWHRRLSWYVLSIAVLILGVGAHAVLRCYGNDPMGAYNTMLMATYLMCAILTLRAYRRVSPGVLVTGLGFFSWSAVWGVAAFAPNMVFGAGVDNAIWDVPKFLVAFGMIVIELEDRSMTAMRSQAHERQLTLQMSKFAELTSKLLTGDEDPHIYSEIATAVVQVSNYERVVILLTNDAGRLFLAGNSGMSGDAEFALQNAVAQTTVKDVEELCEAGRRLGASSYICSRRMTGRFKSIYTVRNFEPNPYWRAGEELIVPLRSPQGNLMGCISLDDPKDVSRVVSEEISALELLANNLAAAIEKSSLQRRVFMHEKLASIGQLVGGVAHELNNPLTVIIGYSELLADADTDKRFERELSTMRREAMRMRMIIDNLLRFARQAKSETNSAVVAPVIAEALALREYELTRKGVTVACDIKNDIPPVHIDEAQLKTVLVNLISNAFDAVESSEEKRISLFARKVANRVLISIIDSGRGFTDVSRAFDPFFSTKGFGRGSGLGLSICYGIVKQHGGEIYAQNVNPAGACVTMELRVSEEGHSPTLAGDSAKTQAGTGS